MSLNLAAARQLTPHPLTLLPVPEREKSQIKKLRQASRKIRRFLEENDKRTGAGGREVQSNITDPDSAKMKTSHGVIQGYVGVAAVDAGHQVIVEAQAFGQGQEHNLLEPMVEGVKERLGREVLEESRVLADSGYHSEETLKYLKREAIDGYVADPGFRARDPRFKDYRRHKPKERLRASSPALVCSLRS